MSSAKEVALRVLEACKEKKVRFPKIWNEVQSMQGNYF